MIRNGYPRRLRAEAERTRLSARWLAYPKAVRQALTTLLHDHGLQAAQGATEAVEQYAKWQHGSPTGGRASLEKQERNDATPTA